MQKISETQKQPTAKSMKENTTNLVGKITKWLMLALVAALVGQTAQATEVFNNTATRATDGGNPLYLSQSSGYQFGDEVVLSPAANAFITNFTFEYYGSGLSGATAVLRIYANNGAVYGTNYAAPGDLLYDSGSFSIGDGPSGGFGTVTVNTDNTPGFGVPVSSNFTWTVEFSGVGAGAAGLAMYDPANAPTVGADYGGYWEQDLATTAWAWRNSPAQTYNFGAVAESQTLALDITIPALAITGPADKFRTDASAPTGVLAVSGTAKDAGGVALVLYNLNSTGFRPATLTSAPLGVTNWTANLNLSVGANTYTVKALDRSGNVKSLPARTCTFVVTNGCTFTFAEGAGSGTTKGIVNIPISSGSTVSNLEIGKTYALEIKENVDALSGLVTHFYSNTVVSSVLGSAIEPSAKFTFVMQTNTSLLINCMTNRFTAIAGEYNGLIGADVTNQASSGFVTLKVDGKRKFSGKMSIAGEILGFAGQFDLSGNANTVGSKVLSGVSKIITSKNQILTNSLRLTMNFGVSPTVSGTLSNDVSGAVTSLIADKYSWSANNPATNYSGTYTMVVPPALANPAGPSGYSHASVIIDTNGLVTMKGLTADGEKLEQKVKLSQNGDWPLFAQNSIEVGISPITAAPNKLLKGSVIGWVSVVPNTDNATTDRVGGELKWIRTENPTALYYSGGFTNISEPVANKYVCNKDASTGKFTNAVVQLNDGGSGIGTGALYISGGSLASTNWAVTSYSNNAVMTVNVLSGTKPPQEAAFTQVPVFGNVNGKFISYLNPGYVIKFFGISLQAENKAYGFFNNTNGYQSGAIIVE